MYCMTRSSSSSSSFRGPTSQKAALGCSLAMTPPSHLWEHRNDTKTHYLEPQQKRTITCPLPLVISNRYSWNTFCKRIIIVGCDKKYSCLTCTHAQQQYILKAKLTVRCYHGNCYFIYHKSQRFLEVTEQLPTLTCQLKMLKT